MRETVTVLDLPKIDVTNLQSNHPHLQPHESNHP